MKYSNNIQNIIIDRYDLFTINYCNQIYVIKCNRSGQWIYHIIVLLTLQWGVVLIRDERKNLECVFRDYIPCPEDITKQIREK